MVVNAGWLNEKTTRTNIWKDANRPERRKNCLEIPVAWNFKEKFLFFFFFPSLSLGRTEIKMQEFLSEIRRKVMKFSWRKVGDMEADSCRALSIRV